MPRRACPADAPAGRIRGHRLRRRVRRSTGDPRRRFRLGSRPQVRPPAAHEPRGGAQWGLRSRARRRHRLHGQRHGGDPVAPREAPRLPPPRPPAAGGDARLHGLVPGADGDALHAPHRERLGVAVRLHHADRRRRRHVGLLLRRQHVGEARVPRRSRRARRVLRACRGRGARLPPVPGRHGARLRRVGRELPQPLRHRARFRPPQSERRPRARPLRAPSPRAHGSPARLRRRGPGARDGASRAHDRRARREDRGDRGDRAQSGGGGRDRAALRDRARVLARPGYPRGALGRLRAGVGAGDRDRPERPRRREPARAAPRPAPGARARRLRVPPLPHDGKRRRRARPHGVPRRRGAARVPGGRGPRLGEAPLLRPSYRPGRPPAHHARGGDRARAGGGARHRSSRRRA